MPVFKKSSGAAETNAPGAVEMLQRAAGGGATARGGSDAPELLRMMYLEPLRVTQSCAGIEYTIHGHNGNVVELNIMPGQKLMTAPGAMLYQSGNVVQTVNTGGVMGMFKRQAAGEGAVMAEFNCEEGVGNVCVRVDNTLGGHLRAINLAEHGGSFQCQTGSFVASLGDIEISAKVHISVGAMGSGMGNTLQEIRGEGIAFISVPSQHQEKRLEEGQEYTLSSGVLVGMSGTATYTATRNKGIGNVLMGGEGLFSTKVTGPGLIFVNLGPQMVGTGRPQQPGQIPPCCIPCLLCCQVCCKKA